MNRVKLILVLIILFLVACGTSSDENSVEPDSYKSLDDEKISGEVALSDCEEFSHSSVIDTTFPFKKIFSDTVCNYNSTIGDTICCFGEPGAYLERTENGEYTITVTDFAYVVNYDTLLATVEPSSISRCLANIGDEHYEAVKIGSQIWFSENAKGEGRCLYDDDDNCEIFGVLMSYDKAKEVCSGNYRLPTNADVEILLQSVGGVMEKNGRKDVCGEIPSETTYKEVSLFVEQQDSVSNNAYDFSFPKNGGIYEKSFDGKDLAYSARRTCFFLQSDESSESRIAFCYDFYKKFSSVTTLGKDAEVYVRCILN